MLNLAVLFLIIALIAFVFGFGLLGATAIGFAKILFFVFLVLAVLSFFRGRGTPGLTPALAGRVPVHPTPPHVERISA